MPKAVWHRTKTSSPGGTVQRSGGSCRFGKGQVDIGDPIKSMPKPSTERSVVVRATNLQQQIGAFSRPSHLLGLVHAPIDQEVRRALGDRSPDAQTGTVPLGLVDQPRG